jgi:hypothetical protein
VSFGVLSLQSEEGVTTPPPPHAIQTDIYMWRWEEQWLKYIIFMCQLRNPINQKRDVTFSIARFATLWFSIFYSVKRNVYSEYAIHNYYCYYYYILYVPYIHFTENYTRSTQRVLLSLYCARRALNRFSRHKTGKWNSWRSPPESFRLPRSTFKNNKLFSLWSGGYSSLLLSSLAS